MYEKVKSDIIIEKLIKDNIGPGDIYKFLSDLITTEKLTVLIVLEELTPQWKEAIDDFPDEVEILEFKTFRRDDAPTVHAHLYKPLFVPIHKKQRESIEEGDLVTLKGERPSEFSEWSWSRIWGQERTVKAISDDSAFLIINEKTRGFWFPLKCLEKVEITSLENQNQKPSQVSEWTESELTEFLGYRSDTQQAFLRTLAERDKVYPEDLLAELKRKLDNKFRGHIGGALGGLSNAINRAHREQLHCRNWDDEGAYSIVEKYREMIKRYFIQQDQQGQGFRFH